MKPDRVISCRSCGAQIALFHDRNTIAHADPECEWFQQLCAGAEHQEVIVLQQPVPIETEDDQSAPKS